MNLDVRRQDLVVQFFRLCLDSLEDVLGLLPAKHENDALDGIVILLEPEFAQAWRMPDGYVSYITHSDGHAFVAPTTMFPMSSVFRTSPMPRT